MQNGRMEIEPKCANAGIFGPRGLKVEIVKTEALTRTRARPGVKDAREKLNKKAILLGPLDGVEMDGRRDDSGQRRRLDALKARVAELEVTPLSEIEVPSNALSRLDMKASERSRSKGEKKLVGKRGEAESEYRKETRKAQQDFDWEMGKNNKNLEKDLRGIDGKATQDNMKQ